MPTAKILSIAAESFSTIQRLVDLSKDAFPSETHQEMQEVVKVGAKKARGHLNGKIAQAHTAPAENSESVLKLTNVLDLIDNVVEDTEPAVKEPKELEKS